MEKITIEVKRRDDLGKGASNRFRQSGLVPAILYGVNDNLPVLIDKKKLTHALSGHRWSNQIFAIKMEGGAKEPIAIIKEIQRNPLSGDIIHLDLFEISLSKKIQVSVHLNFVGTPIGVKQGGGILHHERREVKIECITNLIPSQIEVDISNLDVGKSLHIRDVQVGEGLVIKDNPNLTIVVVNKPKEKEEAASTEETAPETKTD